MIISLGSSPKVIESINRKYKITRENYFFDSILCNFETVLHYLKHIDLPITIKDLYDTGIKDDTNGYRIINHNKLRLSFIKEFSIINSFESYVPTFIELINRRLRHFKKLIINNSYIEFIHCLDEKDNYNFKSCIAYRETDLYIPNNQMIHDLVYYIKKINPNLQFNIHFLVNPNYSDHNKDILNSLINPHLKIHYMTQNTGKYVITAGELCIHWNWDKVYNDLKNNCNIKLPYDFDPIFYKKVYPDLANLTNKEAELHYLEHGIKEDRVYKIYNEIKFDPVVYKRIYKDLSHMSDIEAKIHYICNGIKENRKYRYEDIFDPIKYKELYPDLENMTDREATQHFYQYGIDEGRNIFPDTSTEDNSK
jgi:hypothetical protein